jgi:hypothetical protein
MKPRHAAALALVGWYLMSAPVDPHTMKFDTAEPIKNWKLLDSFDSAAACEAALRDVQKRTAQSGLVLKQGNENKIFPFGLNLDADACIATDDPRLKEK